MTTKPHVVLSEIMLWLDSQITEFCKLKGISVPEGIVWQMNDPDDGPPMFLLGPCFELATKRFVGCEYPVGDAFVSWCINTVED